MSWDVMILNAEETPPSLHGLSKDWTPKPLGDAEDVRAAINTTLRHVDWSNPAWGLYGGDGFTFEINFQATGPVDAFTLHIRGGGDPLPAIVELCRANRWVAFDYSDAEMIDLTEPSRESWKRFQAYRDRVVGK